MLKSNKTITELQNTVEDLKIQAKVSEKLDNKDADIFQWAENMENAESNKGQIQFLKNAFKSTVLNSNRLKKKIEEYEIQMSLTSSKHNSTVNSMQKEIDTLHRQIKILKDENFRIKDGVAKGKTEPCHTI